MLDSLLERAFAGLSSIYLCGGSAADFGAALKAVLKYQPANEHWLKFDVAPDFAAVDFLRAALRQDPDCIVLDQRGSECLEMQLNAVATGHRMISGHPLSPAGALESFQLSVPHFAALIAGGVLAHSLFLEVREGGEIASVHQLQFFDNEPRLVELTRYHEGAWVHLQQPCWQGRYQPPAEDFTPIEVPAEWGHRTEPLLATLHRLRQPRQRTAWAPRLAPSQDESHRGTRYGGIPALRDGEGWPCCQACQARLQLVVQIECQQLPDALRRRFGEGVFQFFYCISDHCSIEEAWAPYSGNSLARQLTDTTQLVAPANHDRPESSPYSAFQVKEWLPLNDSPDWAESAEAEQAAIGYREDFREIAEGAPGSEGLLQRYSKLLEHFQIEPNQLAEVVGLLQNHPGDKLFGWPHWSQGVEYPSCTQCNRTLEMVLQVNNDGHQESRPGFTSCFGQLFAGDGNGHVFRCPDHPEVMTFSWACG